MKGDTNKYSLTIIIFQLGIIIGLLIRICESL